MMRGKTSLVKGEIPMMRRMRIPMIWEDSKCLREGCWSVETQLGDAAMLVVYLVFVFVNVIVFLSLSLSGHVFSSSWEDEGAVDWLKPNWGTRHACGNLIRHHIIHLLAAPPTNEDTDDDEGRQGQYGLIIDQDNQGLSSKSFLNWSLWYFG